MKSAWFFSDNMDYIARVKANNHVDLSTLGMIANRAALTEGEEWLDQVVSYLDSNHDFVVSFVKDNIPLVKCVKAQGTYLTWLDVTGVIDKIGAKQQAASETTKPGEKPETPETIVQRYFVKSAKVHMAPGSNYGHGGAGHMRMNVATSRKTLELALSNLATALKTT